MPLLLRPSGSSWFQGFAPPSATVNLHWPPASDGLQPMPGWPPWLFPTGHPGAWGLAPSNCAPGITWKLGGGGGPGRRRRTPDDLGTESYQCIGSSFFNRLSLPPSSVPRTTARIPTPSVRTGGYFCVDPMPQPPDWLERSQPAPLYLHVRRAMDLPYHPPSYPHYIYVQVDCVYDQLSNIYQ